DGELLDDAPARLVAGDDRDLDAVEVELVEGEAGDGHDRLGHVAVAGLLLVDPVADVRVLERTALHGGEVDLARELAVDEDAEPVPRAELAFALAGAASHGERVTVLDDVGLTVHALGFPFREPVDVATPHLAPGGEIGRDELTKQDAATEQRAHRPSTSPSAPSSN